MLSRVNRARTRRRSSSSRSITRASASRIRRSSACAAASTRRSCAPPRRTWPTRSPCATPGGSASRCTAAWTACRIAAAPTCSRGSATRCPTRTTAYSYTRTPPRALARLVAACFICYICTTAATSTQIWCPLQWEVVTDVLYAAYASAELRDALLAGRNFDRLDPHGTNMRALLRTKPAHPLPRTVELGAGRAMGALLRNNHPEAFKRYSSVDMWAARGESALEGFDLVLWFVSCVYEYEYNAFTCDVHRIQVLMSDPRSPLWFVFGCVGLD